MSTFTPTRITVVHRPDGSMILTVTDLINGTETTTVLDEAERRSLLRGIVNGARDVRGYVVLTHDPADLPRYDVNWDGLLYAKADAAEAEAEHAKEMDQPEAHVGMVLAVLGGPDDQMPARSTDPQESTR
jgi:hypothetical protein